VSAAKPPASGSGKTPSEAEADETEAEPGDETEADEGEVEGADEGETGSSAEGEGVSDDKGEKAAEAPEPGLVLGGQRYLWRDVEAYAAVVGMFSFGGFVLAFVTQLNQWPAAPFVLLFYGMVLGALVASTTSGWRSTLWALIVIMTFWFCVPATRPAYYWVVRRVSLYFLS
jgi:hypothetical protein